MRPPSWENHVGFFLQSLFGDTPVVLFRCGSVRVRESAPRRRTERERVSRNRNQVHYLAFTIGSSTGIEGERAVEPETVAGFGKRGGTYAAGQTALELEYTPTQYFQIELGPTVSYYNIHNVPGLDDRNMGGINGIEADFRSLLIDRGPSPFAVTLSVEPEWHSLDETSGAAVSNYGLETKLEADAELIKNRLFLGFNLLYEPETTLVPLGASFNESTFGVSSALAFQIYPNVVVGADLWYLSHYQGVAFGSFTGDAILSGPTFYWKIVSQGTCECCLGDTGRRARGRRHSCSRSVGLFAPAGAIAS